MANNSTVAVKNLEVFIDAFSGALGGVVAALIFYPLKISELGFKRKTRTPLKLNKALFKTYDKW